MTPATPATPEHPANLANPANPANPANLENPENPKTQLRRDVVGGLTTFFTMAYIVVVNPAILSDGTGIAFSGALTATVLLAVSMTLLMGLYARLPFGVAPGMGLNAFFAYTLVVGQGIPWQVALGIIFWAGVLFLLASLTPVRELAALAIPESLRIASAAGIGLLLTFIGLQNAGFVGPNPATLVGVGPLDHRALLALVGLFVSIRLTRAGNPLAYLAGIFVVTAAAWAGGYVEAPTRWFTAPDFRSAFLRLDALGALHWSLAPAIITVLMTDLFDSLSTFIGVAHAAGLTDERGQPQRLREGLIVDAWATLTAGLLGTSSGTAYVESIAGIRMGGRGGLSAVVTALCFVPCLFVAPLAAAVPNYATAPVLILVGVAMFGTVTRIGFDRLEVAVPAFATLVLIPLTFSITQGILWGFVLHALLHQLVGRGREVTLGAWALAVVSSALLALEHAR